MNTIEDAKCLIRMWCYIVGHDWLYMESIYEKEFNGRICDRCDLHEGTYN